MSFWLDIIYGGGAVASLAGGLLRGRPGKPWDHIKRRALAFDPPAREHLRPALWLHGVSVGEVLASRNLLSRFAEAHPDWDLIISSSTLLGHDAAARTWPDRTVIRFPLDFTRTVDRAFRRLAPALIVVIEHDLWPNFLRRASRDRIPVVLANARLSERSFRRYERLSRVLSWPPRDLAAICSEDEESARRFRALGFEPSRVHVTGNLKFDNPAPPGAHGLRSELGYGGEDWLFLAASTHPGEEEAAIDAWKPVRDLDANARLILAPRRIERVGEVERLATSRGLRVARWSTFAGRGDEDVVLVDTIGDLAKLTALGDVVFVGGSLVPVGGHSVIEPASLGRAILIGPHHENARAVVRRFAERDALRVIRDAEDLARSVIDLYRDREQARELGRRAAEVVESSLGATERTLARIEAVLAERAPK